MITEAKKQALDFRVPAVKLLERRPPFDLLPVFDADTLIDVVPTPMTLNNLLSEKWISPTVAVMAGNVDGIRGTELPCNAISRSF